MNIFTSMENTFKMLADFSQGLYAMWFINVIVGLYAGYVLLQYTDFIKQNIIKFGCQKHLTSRLLQAFSGVFILVMLIAADIWSMSYYTIHTISPLEFFWYAFDLMLVRHLSEEVHRFTNFSS